MMWPALLALALTLSLHAPLAQVDCATITAADVAAYGGYMGPPLDAIRAQSAMLQTQATQLAAQPGLLNDATWLTTARATAASLRAAGLALQQYPSVPPALQGVDTLFTSAGDHLVGAMDDWAGGVDDQDGAQLNNAAVGLQRFLAELSAAAPAFTSMVQCFSR